ncbi:hypothetical protein [Fusobacterium sp. HMSC073F01]|uniref:hypothetical protein n=1 Tax=Fusobacterium sp. HMSC073F01 TaxID=1739251 RepID=UPI00143BB00F|nr:hypothetical protein [Fusobacterium sp. HMSC073F01]
MKDKIVDFFMESKFMDALLDFAKKHPVLTPILVSIVGAFISSIITICLLLL